MPQTLPHFMVGQSVVVALCLGTLVYVFSVYVLPAMLQLLVSRVYVTKL